MEGKGRKNLDTFIKIGNDFKVIVEMEKVYNNMFTASVLHPDGFLVSDAEVEMSEGKWNILIEKVKNIIYEYPDKLQIAKNLLKIILNCKQRHSNNEWHLTVDNNSMYAFNMGCKKLSIKKENK